MQAVRQSIRPKHQVLILKCFPKYQKNVVDVKPNSSELSYLLYYASTRRSKLQKVGAFLEKRTISDVSKNKTGNIQVTLRILKALIEKLPRELALYAHFVLRILKNILHSHDLTTAEDSVPTFEAFCTHHDVASLAADQEHIVQYEEVVRMYASFASQQTPVRTKSELGKPLAIRWRSVGLRAIKSITSSEAVGADGGKQLNIIMPVIIQNLHPDEERYLAMLHQRLDATESTDKETALKRRMSVSTVQTANTYPEGDSAIMSETAEDADRLAEEEVGLQALASLKQIFVANNRLQIRLATTAMLRYICNHVTEQRPSTGVTSSAGTARTWTTVLMEIITRWAPVQDRFVILVTAMESLVRSPIAEENLDKQLVLVGLVGWLLRSNINMIGLSIMDVLLGLIQHILLLLQLGGKGSNVLPHHQQTDAIDLFQETKGLIDQPSSAESILTNGLQSEALLPSTSRQELLSRLQRCIGDLATHIYYSDQISDIITAILLRLKPSPMSGLATDAAAIEHPQAAARAISASVKLQENPNTDEFFSFGTARVTALKAIKQVLITANLRGSMSGAAVTGRNRVSVQVWEGTQWLIRDEDRRVRRAYADALLTWLKLEMSRGDLRVMEDKRKLFKGSATDDKVGGATGNLTRRAVSSASHREKVAKPAKSTFLQLLHLAIYDNAIETPESEADLLLVHLVLVSLVDKLGVNAAKSGLPMIMRLQEDINDDKVFSTPTAKSNIGSLVHGYFWALSDKFDLDTTAVGYEIYTEITRRRKHDLWLDTIQVPPLPLDQIMSASTKPISERLPLPKIQLESLRPFDSRMSLVGQIAVSYAESLVSPPSSPPASPGRVFSLPVLSPSSPKSSPDDGLPERIREAMLAEWSKEATIASIEKETARSISLNGSRTGTNMSARHFLAVDGQAGWDRSPMGANDSPRDSSPNQLNDRPRDGTPPQPLQRRLSARDDGSPTPLSSSDQNPTLRVDDLKKVLAGGALAGRAFSSRGASPLRQATIRRDLPTALDQRSVSSTSESAVSAEGFESASEGDLSRPLPPPVPAPLSEAQSENIPKPATDPEAPSPAFRKSTPRTSEDKEQRPRSAPRRPSTASSAGEDPVSNARALRGEVVTTVPSNAGELGDEEVPPVPPLPLSVALQKNVNVNLSLTQPTHIPLSNPSVGATALKPEKQSGSLRVKKRGKGVDVNALLGSIDSVAGERRSLSGMGKPPY